MANSFDTVAQVIAIDSTKLPPDYIEIFTSAKKGDSVLYTQSTDSIVKYNAVPPYAKKGPGHILCLSF